MCPVRNVTYVSGRSTDISNEFDIRLLTSRRTFGLEVNVIRSEIRSSAELKPRFAFASAPFTPTKYRAQNPLVQVDYVRVVDLDIGASKSDNLGDQSIISGVQISIF